MILFNNALWIISGSIQPLQDDNTVKVGAKGGAYGNVTVNVPTGLYKIKLVYSSGFLACIPRGNYKTTFGCHTPEIDRVDMVITTTDNLVLLPGSKEYKHDGNLSRSLFVTFNDAIHLVQGEKLRIWYKEDLKDKNNHELDNLGATYMHVLAIKQT